MEIKNPNFICPLMQKRDIQEAFVFQKGSSFVDELYKLIGDGYLQKKGDRFYIPTQKLMDEAFLPKNGFIVMEDHQRRFLNNNNGFYFKDLVICFGNETIVNRMIKVGYLRLENDKRYRKSSLLDDLLVEGQDIIKL